MQDHSVGLDASGLDIADARLEEALEALVGPPGKWRETRDVQLHMLSALGLERQHRLLDLGCGSLRAGLPLIRYLDPGKYIGVDVEPACIEAGHSLVSKFDLAAKLPTLFAAGDFGQSALPQRSIDRIWCFQVVIHLDRQRVGEFVAATAGLLAPGGRAWFTARMPDPGRESLGDAEFRHVGGWKGFPVTAAGFAFFATAAVEAGLEARDLGRLSQWGMSSERKAAGNRLIELTRPSNG